MPEITKTAGIEDSMAEPSVTGKAQVVRAIFDAYIKKDRASIERLLADDFRFTSPMDNALSRQAYLEICWPSSQIMESFDFKHVVEDGDRVFVTYEASIRSGKRFRNTEVLTIRGEQVASVEVYFGWNLPHDVPPGSHRDPRS